MTQVALVAPLPLVGNLLSFVWYSKFLSMPSDGFLHFANHFPKHDFIAVSMGRVLNRKMILVQNPDIARTILQNASSYHKGPGYQIFRDVTPGHLPGLDGDEADKKRKLAMSLFSSGRMQQLQTLAGIYMKEFAEELLTCTADRPFEATQKLRDTTLSIISHSLLGEPLRDGKVVAALRKIMDEWHHRVIELSRFQHWKHLPRQRALTSARKLVRQYLFDRLNDFKKQDLPHADCMLRDLVSINDEQSLSFSDNELVDVMFTLLAMGHENISSCLSWVLAMIANHEDFQLQIKKEYEGATDVEDMLNRRAPFTQAIIQETLRLYPPIPLLSRKCIDLSTLQTLGLDGQPEDIELIVSPYVLHRQKNFWGEDAESFNPQRWMDADLHAVRRAYMPFGSGPRACIGQQLAYLQTKVMLATIFGTSDKIVMTSDRIKPVLQISLKPKRGLRLVCRKP